MDILKKLEQKIQALVAQRNQLREDLECIKAEHGKYEAEIQQLRRRIEDMQSEHSAIIKERDEVRQQVESIVQQLEQQLEALA